MPEKSEPINRRDFLKKGIQAGAAALIVPRFVLGGKGYTPPSDGLSKAVIGVGGMGRVHLSYPGSRLVAVCDVDENHLKIALEMAGPGVKGFKDFREVLERSDIDIVHIATPPHWHGVISRAAAETGKDIWCEKPMTRTIEEGKKVVQAVQRNGRIFRVNTWFRFQDQFYGAGTSVKSFKKAVMNRMLGWPLKVTVSGVTGFDWKFYWRGRTDLTPQPVPKELDYDFWLGPAPYKPYHPHRVHTTFRGYWDYDGGGLGDMGMHYLDPVQYLLEKDHTSPVRVEAECPQQHPDACRTWRRIEMEYSDGCQVILDGENKDKKAPFIEGPEGKIFRGFQTNILNFKKNLASLPDPEPQKTDFIKAVKERRKFALNEGNAHRSCTLVNLCKIAVRLGRPLRFDPDKQCFINDPQADRLLDQPMRAPWRM